MRIFIIAICPPRIIYYWISSRGRAGIIKASDLRSCTSSVRINWWSARTHVSRLSLQDWRIIIYSPLIPRNTVAMSNWIIKLIAAVHATYSRIRVGKVRGPRVPSLAPDKNRNKSHRCLRLPLVKLVASPAIGGNGTNKFTLC